MRSDFEILLYNMIQWLCSYLPWEKNLKDPSSVQQQKERAFNNVQKFLKECFITREVPAPINQFMSLLASLKYNEAPNYNKFRDILSKGLQKMNHTTIGKLEFTKKKCDKTDKPLSTPKKSKISAVESKGSAKKAKSTPAAKSPRGKRNMTPTNDSLNTSIDSVVLDEKCMSGRDMRRQLLANIDGDAEYEVQIKKRKTKANASNGMTLTKPTARTGRRKVERQVDTSITDSEPEVKNYECKLKKKMYVYGTIHADRHEFGTRISSTQVIR